MKIKEHIIILLLIFLMLFVCIGSVSALKNQTDDYAENEIIGIGGSPDGGTFKELQDKITDAGENGTVDLANNYTYDDSFSKNGIISSFLFIVVLCLYIFIFPSIKRNMQFL